MSLETDLRAFLADDDGIGELVGTRIYPDVAAQGAALPHLVYTRITTDRGHTMDGPEGVQRPQFLMPCWAETRLSARALADKVRAALDGYKGAMGETTVQAVFIRGDSDVFEFDPTRYISDLEFEIWAEE